MDSKKSLTGTELYEFYLVDKSNAHFNHPENLKILLNYTLDNMEETNDSNLEMEIVDFCVEKLKDCPSDKKQITFYREKYALIEKQLTNQRRKRTFCKFAAVAAVFAVVVVAFFVGGQTESKAGIFDWVSALFVEDKVEQLSMELNSQVLANIEVNEEHLPSSLPDGYLFKEYYRSSSSLNDNYQYLFVDTNNHMLTIDIKEYKNLYAPIKNELEMSNKTYKTVTTNNQTYYYFNNNNLNTISWLYNNKIFYIQGEFSCSELEEILLCYQKEQIEK